MNKTLQPKFKTEICDNCKKEFKRGWIPNLGKFSNINLISHWTRDESKTWRGNKLVCVPCLLEWYKEDKTEFKKIVPANRYQTFANYISRGLIKEYKE